GEIGAFIGNDAQNVNVGEPRRDNQSSYRDSPRHRRGSGSVTSQDGGSPRGSPRASPRESLNASPQPIRSPRSSPEPTFKPIITPTTLPMGIDTGASIGTFSLPGFNQDSNFLSAGFPHVGSPSRKRPAMEVPDMGQGKIPHVDLVQHLGFPIGFPIPPHLAYLALRPDLAALAPELMKHWNGQPKRPYDEEMTTKLPATPLGMGASEPNSSEAARALERMSELSKLGRDMAGLTPRGNLDLPGSLGGASSRASAWQSHWLNKGQNATKDVFKCVWCKLSYGSLADLTKHMKEAKHCGVNLPPQMPHMPTRHTFTPPFNTHKVSGPSHTRTSHPMPASGGRIPSNDFYGSSFSKEDRLSSVRETIPLPRKLVRGQDVWIGKGAEQTRQILKCMWCGESFKTLKEMTTHMQKTQHYTNIISQEQIISWKSNDQKQSSEQHVNAVMTCKVCDLTFSSLKELSDHMVKNAHYKEHLMKSISESGPRRRPSKEKRKKSLPVRKLLELERAQQDFQGMPDMVRSGKDIPGPRLMLCEKCDCKIFAHLFIDHIRNCDG
ncbi:unnamed protein product, partial [Meganyctiphanes norvegica]